MPIFTADLCDAHDDLQILEIPLRDFGGRTAFAGPIRTVKAHEDNSKVKQVLAEPGDGAVLVVDAGGSRRRAMCGGNVAALAAKHGWSALVIWGCIRDVHEIEQEDVGVRALGTHPCKTDKHDIGWIDVPVRFGGVTFEPGHWLYADRDGLVVADRRLH